VYLRSDIAGDRKRKYEFESVESISVEINMNKKKWLLIGAYKPPTVSENIFTSDFIKCLDQVTCNYDNFMVLGDLKFDYLHAEKGNALKNVCDIFDLTNLIKNPTCLCKDANPSLVDVILTNKPTSCGKICNFDCGISDEHNIISVQFKSEMPQKSKSKRLFRSYKNFDN
jgi:hypothetical protein